MVFPTFNTGHYFSHGALSDAELPSLEEDQKQGIVKVLPSIYDSYTQCVICDNRHERIRIAHEAAIPPLAA